MLLLLFMLLLILLLLLLILMLLFFFLFVGVVVAASDVDIVVAIVLMTTRFLSVFTYCLTFFSFTDLFYFVICKTKAYQLFIVCSRCHLSLSSFSFIHLSLIIHIFPCFCNAIYEMVYIVSHIRLKLKMFSFPFLSISAVYHFNLSL